MLSYKYGHPCTGNHEVLNTEECQNQTQGSPHVNNKKNRHFDIVWSGLTNWMDSISVLEHSIKNGKLKAC